jgi:SAM-dependent methyltransferase
MQKIKLANQDIQDTIERYTSRYIEYGYSPKSLGWDKGKQDIRFKTLTSEYNFTNKTVLDIGCGFGDLNKELSRVYKDSYAYIGIDIVPSLISEGRIRFGDKNSVSFYEGDFLSSEFAKPADFAIASGIFNHKLVDGNNYSIIEESMKKAFDLCNDGFAFDFLSDRVDYRLTHTFHSSPELILSFAYKLSRNVVLKSNYMPFEFSIFVFKDDTYNIEDTVFNRYKAVNQGAGE